MGSLQPCRPVPVRGWTRQKRIYLSFAPDLCVHARLLYSFLYLFGQVLDMPCAHVCMDQRGALAVTPL